jgi:pentatricopeptide repeat protein
MCYGFVGSYLVDLYVKYKKMENACQVVEEMPKFNEVSYNAKIVRYAKNGQGEEAILLLHQK